MRARWRKASCLSADSYEEDDAQRPGDELLPQSLPETSPAFERQSVTSPLPSDLDPGDMGEAYEQLPSGFFATLPAEVRRMIYTELWRASNPLLKMHIHSSAGGPRLVTTPCHYVPKATYSTRDDEIDPVLLDPRYVWTNVNLPPRWFWHAWGLRMKWGVHWKCQAAAMLDWQPRADGTCQDLRGSGGEWLGCFLTCRRMYAEAIDSLFESTQLIFTASEDAYRFFVQNPHSHLDKIRNVDFAFSHSKDHLFLQPIESKHPRLEEGTSSASVPVSWGVWLPLMLCVRERMPDLRELRIHIDAPNVRGDGFVETLDEWEHCGYGWLVEQEGGCIYLESRRESNILTGPRQRDGFI
ncbi:unnamed protein product [Discula destructiva]